jgi:hypothetical protein
VKVEPLEGVEAESVWLSTDSSGRAVAAVWAPASSVPDAAGLVSGRVRLKVVGDGAVNQREQDIHIPYARVVAANGATLVARSGELLEPFPIFSGSSLRPGDVVQVGDELIWSGTYLTIQFCSGQQVTLQASTPGGLRAVVGQGSLDHRASVLDVTLQNIVQDLRANPRRYGRLLVYKVLGNVVDSFLGLPDPVGWTVTTPGGALEKWLADFLEPAPASPSRAKALGKEGEAELTAASGSPPADAPWVGMQVDFFSDATARVYNQGATVHIQSPAAGVAVPRSGMTVARLDVPGGSLSSVGVSPVSSAAPMLTFVPAPGTTEVPRRPVFEVTVSETGGNPVLPGGVLSRVDGVLLRTQPWDDNSFRFTLPRGMALTPGPHHWDLELALSGGGILRTTVTFQVTSTVPTGLGVRAAAGSRGVALWWPAEALEWAPGGFRVYRTVPGVGRTLVSGPQPLTEPNSLDTAPAAGAVYEITAVDPDGSESPVIGTVHPAFPGPAAPVPGSPHVTPVVLENGAGLGLAIEDRTPGFTLWRVEAGPTADGPFTDLLDGQLTSRTLWPIPKPWEETRQWFRITAINADGVSGPPAVVGPLDLPRPLPPILGVTVSPNQDGSARLCWNPWTARPLAGYRIEVLNGDAWQTAAEVARDVTVWTDSTLTRGELRQWRVRARLLDGEESPASAPVAMTSWPVPADPGEIRFSASLVSGLEGETVPVTVVREGGLDLPAFVSWSTWGHSGTATPDFDFVPGAGLLVFAPSETEKVIPVTLLTDELIESDDEFLFLDLLAVEGGPRLAQPTRVQVAIGDGPIIQWNRSHVDASEEHTGEVCFQVVLTRPPLQEVRVDFQFDPNSTATPGVDFTGPLSGTLTFAPGETNQSFTIRILDDAFSEGTETVTYRLRNPKGAALDYRESFHDVCTLSIHDHDRHPGYVSFAQPMLVLREGESRALTLRREGGLDGAIAAFVFQQGGTATEDLDWTIEPRVARFEDGQTEVTLTVHAVEDGSVEGAEVAVLNMSSDGDPAPVASLLVIIHDADSAGSGFNRWADQALPAQPPAVRAPTADPDGDGRPNLVEYLLLTDPARADGPSLPMFSFDETGQCTVTVTLREDPAVAVWAEFANELSWTWLTIDAGTWQSNGDGTRTGTFRYYSFPFFGERSAFMRLRAHWLEAP